MVDILNPLVRVDVIRMIPGCFPGHSTDFLLVPRRVAEWLDSELRYQLTSAPFSAGFPNPSIFAFTPLTGLGSQRGVHKKLLKEFFTEQLDAD